MSERQFHFDPDTYLEVVRREVPAYDEIQEAVVDATEGLRVGALLELGPGTGETTRRVTSRHPSARVVAVEALGTMAAVFRAAQPGAEVHVGYLEDPLPPGPFDLVVSALAVHHVPGSGKADVFRRVAGALRPGGRFVLGDVVVPDDPAEATTPLEEGVDHPDPVPDLLAWLAAAGFAARVTWARGDLAVIAADRPSD